MKYWLTDTERETLQDLTSMRGLEKSDAEKQQVVTRGGEARWAKIQSCSYVG